MKIVTVSDMLAAMPNIVGVQPPDGACVFLAVNTTTQTVKVSGVIGGEAAADEESVQECTAELAHVLRKMEKNGMDPDEIVFVVAFWNMESQDRSPWYAIFEDTDAHFYALDGGQWSLACPPDCPMWEDDEPVTGVLMPPDPELDKVMRPPLPHDIAPLIEEATVEANVLATIRNLPIGNHTAGMWTLVSTLIDDPDPQFAPYEAAMLERIMAEAEWWSDAEFLGASFSALLPLNEGNRRRVRDIMLAMVPYLRNNTALTLVSMLMWCGGGGHAHVALILEKRCTPTTLSMLLEAFMAAAVTPDEVMSGFLASLEADR